jgi:hypothetical protein
MHMHEPMSVVEGQVLYFKNNNIIGLKNVPCIHTAYIYFILYLLYKQTNTNSSWSLSPEFTAKVVLEAVVIEVL